jgi:hypothetical protein
MTTKLTVSMLTVCEYGHVCQMTGSYVPEMGTVIFGSDADHCQKCESEWDEERGSMTIIGKAPDPSEDKITWAASACGVGGCVLLLQPDWMGMQGWHGFHAVIDGETARVWKALAAQEGK